MGIIKIFYIIYLDDILIYLNLKEKYINYI